MKHLLIALTFLLRSDAPDPPHCLVLHVVDQRVMVSPDLSDTTHLLMSYVVSDMGATMSVTVPIYPEALMCYRNPSPVQGHPQAE